MCRSWRATCARSIASLSTAATAKLKARHFVSPTWVTRPSKAFHICSPVWTIVSADWCTAGAFSRRESLLMKLLLGLVTLFVSVALCPAADLEEVANFPNQQVTGVTVSKSGRIFVNFPDWSDDHTISVAELIDRQPKPFPNDEWNKPGPAAMHFVCVQSVVVDANDVLWVLDPRS